MLRRSVEVSQQHNLCRLRILRALFLTPPEPGLLHELVGFDAAVRFIDQLDRYCGKMLGQAIAEIPDAPVYFTFRIREGKTEQEFRYLFVANNLPDNLQRILPVRAYSFECTRRDAGKIGHRQADKFQPKINAEDAVSHLRKVLAVAYR